MTTSTRDGLRRRQRRAPRVFAAPMVALFSLLTFWSSLLSAQEEQTLNAKQVEYYNKGLEAHKTGDFERSVEYYELAIKEGTAWNILLLGIGRAYSKQGDCAKADAYFVKALAAKPVAQPSAEVIKAKIDEYRIDLRLSCKGTLEVACKPADMQVRVNQNARRACSEFPVELPAGEYTVSGAAYGAFVEKKIKVVGLESVKVELALDKPAEPAGGAKLEPEPPHDPHPSALKTWGWITTGVGAAVLTGALLTDATVLSAKVDDFKKAADARASDEDTLYDEASSLQSTVLIGYVAGAAVTTVGVGLLVAAMFGENQGASPDGEAVTLGAVGAWLGDGGGGLSLAAQW